MFPALNYTNKVVDIEKGTRCCQMLILPVANVIVKEVEKMGNKDRGGFGSTGKE
jgi:dUTPase